MQESLVDGVCRKATPDTLEPACNNSTGDPRELILKHHLACHRLDLLTVHGLQPTWTLILSSAAILTPT